MFFVLFVIKKKYFFINSTKHDFSIFKNKKCFSEFSFET